MRSPGLALLLLLLLGPGAAAQAATVGVEGERLVFAGAPSEKSAVSVSDDPSAGWFAVSAARPPTPRPGCRRTSNPARDPSVRCDRAGVRSVELRLGPLDDAAAVLTELPVRIEAGAGRDILAPPLDGIVDAGDGADLFELRPEYDGDARLDGGPGVDTFRLMSLPDDRRGSGMEGWSVNLEDGAIEPAARLSFAGVEALEGSAQADSLSGDDAANSLSGSVGPDSLSGSGGRDRLDAIDEYSAEGRAGAGYTDYVYWSDRIACGDGADRVLADRTDRWASDCERVLVHRSAVLIDPDEGTREPLMLHVRTVLNGDGGANRLIGSARVPNRVTAGDGSDRIVGGAWRDTIDAGAGDDRVVPRPGRDRVDTGPGDDAVDAAEGTRDVIRCGDGTDDVTADRRDLVAADCEHVALRWNS
jgi:Ca2+-binding RTX toxin-like protein